MSQQKYNVQQCVQYISRYIFINRFLKYENDWLILCSGKEKKMFHKMQPSNQLVCSKQKDKYILKIRFIHFLSLDFYYAFIYLENDLFVSLVKRDSFPWMYTLFFLVIISFWFRNVAKKEETLVLPRRKVRRCWHACFFFVTHVSCV